jgi:predicted O-methyltransferase YrrM
MLEDIIKKSDSLNIQRYVAKMIKRPSAHEHTHILYDIVTMIGNENKKVDYLEIGSYLGSSACLVQQNEFTNSITCIEAREDFAKEINTNLTNLNKHNIDFTIHNHRSTDAIIIDKLTDKSFDLLFIDGDHSHDGVLSDFNIYKDLVKPGGYIVFDDYLDSKYSPGVMTAVDYIVRDLIDGDFEVIGMVQNHHNARVRYDIGKMMNEFIIKKL